MTLEVSQSCFKRRERPEQMKQITIDKQIGDKSKWDSGSAADPLLMSSIQANILRSFVVQTACNQ